MAGAYTNRQHTISDILDGYNSIVGITRMEYAEIERLYRYMDMVERRQLAAQMSDRGLAGLINALENGLSYEQFIAR